MAKTLSQRQQEHADAERARSATKAQARHDAAVALGDVRAVEQKIHILQGSPRAGQEPGVISGTEQELAKAAEQLRLAQAALGRARAAGG